MVEFFTKGLIHPPIPVSEKREETKEHCTILLILKPCHKADINKFWWTSFFLEGLHHRTKLTYPCTFRYMMLPNQNKPSMESLLFTSN